MQTDKLIKSLKVANLKQKLEVLEAEQKLREEKRTKAREPADIYVRLTDSRNDLLDSGRLRKMFRPYGKIVNIRYKTEFSFVGFESLK